MDAGTEARSTLVSRRTENYFEFLLPQRSPPIMHTIKPRTEKYFEFDMSMGAGGGPCSAGFP